MTENLSPNQRIFLLNSVWQSIRQGSKLLSSFLVLIFVARIFGPEQFGLYQYTITLFFFIELPLNFIHQDIELREFSREGLDKESMLWSIIFGKFLFSLLYYALVYYASSVYFTPEQEQLQLLVQLISLSLLFQPFETFIRYFMATQKPHLAGLLESLTLLLSSGLKILVALTTKEIKHLLLINVLQLFIQAIVMGAFVPRIRPHLNFEVFMMMVKKSLPFFSITIMTTIIQKLNQVIVAEYLSAADLGEYNAAQKIIDVFNYLPFLLVRSALPLLAQNDPSSNHAYARVKKVFFINNFGIIIAAIIAFITAPYILPRVFGDKYPHIIEIFRWLLITTLPLSWSTLNLLWDVVIIKNAKFALTKYSISAAFTILFALVLIPKFGWFGVVITQTMSMLILGVLLNFFNPFGRKVIMSLIESWNIKLIREGLRIK